MWSLIEMSWRWQGSVSQTVSTSLAVQEPGSTTCPASERATQMGCQQTGRPLHQAERERSSLPEMATATNQLRDQQVSSS